VTTTPYALISSRDMRSLLMRYTAAHVTDDLVSAWFDRLSGCTAADVQEAFAGLGPAAARATPSEIADRIEAAGDRPVVTSPDVVIPLVRRPGAKAETRRDYYRQAGARGIRAVYAAMGWEHNPDRELARAVPCPFCKARTWAVCSPLSRNRAGVRELRDRATGMHPSRLDRAKKQLARTSTPRTEQETSR
jgi:hypothetical protein